MQHDYPEITDYNYMLSTVGNAYYSGISFRDLWGCVSNTTNVEDLDTAVSATILLSEVCDNYNRSVR